MTENSKKILIVSFSPSGCCASLAEDACTVLEHDQHNVLVCDITDPGDREVILEHSIRRDVLILICPVYHKRIPSVVSDFFAKFKVSAQRAILILGYGSMGVGSAARDARKMFSKINIPLYRVMKYPTEHTYSFAVSDEQHISDELGGLVFFLRSAISEKIKTLPEIYPEPDMFRFIPSKLLASMNAGVPLTDMNKCNLCDKCASFCPTGALSADNTTVDTAKCIRCGECVRICPENAKSIKVSLLMKLAMKRAFAKEAVSLELTERK